MTGGVTKAIPIQFVNGKSRIKKQRGHKTALSSYYACLSRDLLLMPSGADTHTHTPTFTNEMISRNQACMGFSRLNCFVSDKGLDIRIIHGIVMQLLLQLSNKLHVL